MSSKTRFESKENSPTSSSSFSINEETSNPAKKNKRYVKKKGESRKRNSIENFPQQLVAQETMEIDKISKKLEEMVIKSEKGDDPASTTNNNSVGIEGGKISEEKIDQKATGKKVGGKTMRKNKKNENFGNKNLVEEKKKLESEKEDEEEEKKEEPSATGVEKNVQGESLTKFTENKDPGETEKGNQNERKKSLGLAKNLDKGKTAGEERKRNRETARFAKAVARFSMKFSKAAKQLGIIGPAEEESSSFSDSSSSYSSCSSSCTCSSCCTTDSSTCSCSDCVSTSEGCSTCSSSPTSSSGDTFSSSSTLNSSTTSTSSSSS